MVLRVAYQSDSCQLWYSVFHASQRGVSSGTQSGIPVRQVSVVVLSVSYQLTGVSCGTQGGIPVR